MASQRIPGGMDPENQYITLVSTAEPFAPQGASSGRFSHRLGSESVSITGTGPYSPTIEVMGEDHLKRMAEFLLEVCKERKISIVLP